MKKIYAILLAVLVTAGMFAQIPQKMSYQAVIRDASNNLVKSHNIGMRISILQGSASGTAVYTETQTASTNANGLVTIEIGAGTTSDNFSAINWSSGIYFVKTETDPDGGTSYSINGASQLLSVPYSLYAKTAGNGFSGNYSDLANKPNIKDTVIMYGFNGNYNALTNKPTIADSISKYSVLLKGNQTIAGNKTFTGTIKGTVDANNTAVSNVATPVNTQDAATKAYVDVLKLQIKALEDNLIEAGNYQATDIDGHKYHVIKIGNQVWMKEDLKVTHYTNGKLIPYVTDNTEWKNLTTGARCYFVDDPDGYTYGALYNWYTVGTDSLCPTGWHVPSDVEYNTLFDYLGGVDGAGDKLKEAGTEHWIDPNTGTNESGFTALPGGFRRSNGSMEGIGYYGEWWSTTVIEGIEGEPWYWELNDNLPNVNPSHIDPRSGFSVRCLKDE